jgi:hypothetical protein
MVWLAQLMLRISLGYVIIGLCWTMGMLLGAPVPEKVTVCEVLVNPLKYDGKMILLEGEISGTDEGGWLTEVACPIPFVTGGHVWPNSIFLQGDPTDKHNVHKVDFAYDNASEQRAYAKAKRLEQKYPGKKLRWTYQGLLETRTDWAPFLARYPNGTSRYIGFGHLSEAPAQLIVKAVQDVSVAP